VPISGGSPQLIYENTSNVFVASLGSWSPDGLSILANLDIDRNEAQDLVVISVADGTATSLTEDSFAPDSVTTIGSAFWRGNDEVIYSETVTDTQTSDKTRRILATTIDGSNERLVHETSTGTISSGGFFFPSRSGEAVLFVSTATGTPEVYQVAVPDSAGSNVTPLQLTENSIDEIFPLFGPRGQQIVAQVTDTEAPAGFLLGDVGSPGSFVRVTSTPGDLFGGWAPDGSAVVFSTLAGGEVSTTTAERVLAVARISSDGQVTTQQLFESQGAGVIQQIAW